MSGSKATVPHAGSAITVGGVGYQLSSRAAPRGWWAIPVQGGRPVRVVLDRRGGSYRWVVAR